MPETSIHIPYPWQQDVWHTLQQQIAQDKTPHALLLAGQKGIGKWHLAEALADYLLCIKPRADLACGECRSCQWLLSQTHPDKQVYAPEDEGKQIKIDQIRQLSTFVSKTAQQGGKKVVILGPVEQLNTNAANALLKSLEEPAGDTILILVSHVSSGVIATIRSRCQQIALSAPQTPVAIQWLNDLKVSNPDALLQLSGGAPLIAREMIAGDYLEHLQLFVQNLLQLSQISPSVSSLFVAKQWMALDLMKMTQWWLQIIHGMMTVRDATSLSKMSHEDADSNEQASNISSSLDRLNQQGEQLNKQWLFKFSDKLMLLRKQQLQGANPNMQLLLEELLLDWQAIIRQSGPK